MVREKSLPLPPAITNATLVFTLQDMKNRISSTHSSSLSDLTLNKLYTFINYNHLQYNTAAKF